MISVNKPPSFFFKTELLKSEDVKSISDHTFALKKVEAIDSEHFLLVSSYLFTPPSNNDGQKKPFQRFIKIAKDENLPKTPYLWVYSDQFHGIKECYMATASHTRELAAVAPDMMCQHYNELFTLYACPAGCTRRKTHEARGYIARLIESDTLPPDKKEKYQHLLNEYDLCTAQHHLELNKFIPVLEQMVQIMLDDLFSPHHKKGNIPLQMCWIGNKPPGLFGRNLMAGMSVDEKFKNLDIHLWTTRDIADYRYCYDKAKKCLDTSTLRKKYEKIHFHFIEDELLEDRFPNLFVKLAIYTANAIIKTGDPKSFSSAVDVLRKFLVLESSLLPTSKHEIFWYKDFDKPLLTRIEDMSRLNNIQDSKLDLFLTHNNSSVKGYFMACRKGTASSDDLGSQIYYHTKRFKDGHDMIQTVLDATRFIINLRNNGNETGVYSSKNEQICRYFLMGLPYSGIELIFSRIDLFEKVMTTKFHQLDQSVKTFTSSTSLDDISRLKDEIDSFVNTRSKLMNLSGNNYHNLGYEPLNQFILEHMNARREMSLATICRYIRQVASTMLVDSLCNVHLWNKNMSCMNRSQAKIAAFSGGFSWIEIEDEGTSRYIRDSIEDIDTSDPEHKRTCSYIRFFDTRYIPSQIKADLACASQLDLALKAIRFQQRKKLKERDTSHISNERASTSPPLRVSVKGPELFTLSANGIEPVLDLAEALCLSDNRLANGMSIYQFLKDAFFKEHQLAEQFNLGLPAQPSLVVEQTTEEKNKASLFNQSER